MITATFSSVSDALSLSCQCGTLPNTGVDLRRPERVDSLLNLWSPPVPSFFSLLSGADEESRGGLRFEGRAICRRAEEWKHTFPWNLHVSILCDVMAALGSLLELGNDGVANAVGQLTTRAKNRRQVDTFDCSRRERALFAAPNVHWSDDVD